MPAPEKEFPISINLPRQTLARWVKLSAQWLTPLYQQIKAGVMAGGYVQLDETPVDYLEPGAGRTLKGYLWTGSRPGGDVFFDWHVLLLLISSRISLTKRHALIRILIGLALNNKRALAVGSLL